jgi:hypothetical protein
MANYLRCQVSQILTTPMADTVRKLLGKDTDHRQALTVAQEIAALFKSRVTANEKIIIG